MVAFLAALLVVAIWGETFVSSKVLIDAGLMPADIFFYRFVLAYALIWIISPKKLWARDLKDEAALALAGVMGGSLYFLAENSALIFSTASNVAILVSSAPLMTAVLLSFFYRDERMNARQFAGSLVAFVGMALVVLNGQLVLKISPKGDLLALAAAVTWALYSLAIKSVSTRYDSVFITRKVFFYGLLTILPYFVFVHPLQTDPAILFGRPAVWGNLLYLGVVASMLCYVLWNWALAKLGAVRATNIIYLQSFFTMLIGYLVLEERITWMAILGTVVLTLGMMAAAKKSE